MPVMREFKTEASMVRRVVDHLYRRTTPWGQVRVAREFNYSAGRTDIVATTDQGELVAFEAKLTNWRAALQQAFRNTAFANTSYVVLPRASARIAGRFLAEFERRSVGLCVVEKDEIIIINEAVRQEPLQPWLHSQAMMLVAKSHERATNSRRSSPCSRRRTSTHIRAEDR